MKMYLNDFKELTMAELLSVNGGYTTTAYYSTSSGGYKETSVPTDQPAPPHSVKPDHYSETSGWEPGWGPDGYHGVEEEEESADPSNPAVPSGPNNPAVPANVDNINDSIAENSGTNYDNDCDDWVIGVLNDAGEDIGGTALEGDKTCAQRKAELTAQCDNEVYSSNELNDGQWYVGCSSDHMFLVKKNSDGSYQIADTTGFEAWNNGLSGSHGINDYNASPTYGGSDAIYIPL